MINLPMPNEVLGESTVVASTWLSDGDDGDMQAMVLTLNPTRPFYSVVQLASDDGTRWTVTATEDAPNIVPAVRTYEDWGGDY